jgi:predicted DNA-binding transcriptional regulator YafY
MQNNQPSTSVLSVSELALGIKCKSKRARLDTLLQFLVQHQGSFVSKRRMSALLSVTDRSLYRYLGELKTLVPIESKSGMYGLANVA